MKNKRARRTPTLDLAHLRQRELELACKPSAEAYLELADQYHAMGLQKESDRLLQLAESIESGDSPQTTGLLSGTATTVMIMEVIQILSRTRASGDFVIESDSQVFHLYFDRGQIVNASSQNHADGVESFRMALRVTSGKYYFLPKPIKDVSRLIAQRTEVLLLDALHEADTATVRRATV